MLWGQIIQIFQSPGERCRPIVPCTSRLTWHLVFNPKGCFRAQKIENGKCVCLSPSTQVSNGCGNEWKRLQVAGRCHHPRVKKLQMLPCRYKEGHEASLVDVQACPKPCCLDPQSLLSPLPPWKHKCFFWWTSYTFVLGSFITCFVPKKTVE